MAQNQLRENVKTEVSRLLKEERLRRGISMNVLAQKSGLSQSLISGFESYRWNPTLDSLLRIALVLEVNLGEILMRAIENVKMRGPSL